MKTSLIKLVANNNISKDQYEAALHYFKNVQEYTLKNGWVEITESKVAGYYDVQYSFNSKIFKTSHDTFKFTKEEYLTI